MHKPTILAAAALAAALPATPSLAQGTPAAPAAAKARYTTTDTSIGDLLADPAAKAIVDKHLPGFSTSDGVAMANGMTLRSVQQFAQGQITDKTLNAIDTDLANLPGK